MPVFLGNIDENNRVGFIHNFPFEPEFGLGKSIEELEQIGVLVESMPKEEGEVIGTYVNKETKEVTYEYQIPKTKEQMIAELQEQISKLQEE